MQDGRIRLAILMHGRDSAPAWIAELIGRIRASDFLDLVMVGRAPHACRPAGPAIWRLFTLLDRWSHSRDQDSFATMPIAPLLSAVPRAGVSKIAAASAAGMLDVVLDLTAHRRGPDVPAPEHGSWWVEGGSPDDPRMFWAFRGRERSAEVRLRRSGRDGVEVIGRAHILTDQESIFRTTNAAQWKCGTLVMRALHQLHLERRLRGEPERAATDPPSRPTAADVVRVGFRIASAFFRRRTLGSRERNVWFLALRKKNWRRLAERDDRGFRPIFPPPGHFYADPFLFKEGGRTYLFFEDFIDAESKAVISCAEVTSSGLGSPRVVVRADHHLSYPFVFRQGGAIYMLPESTNVRRLDLFRAVEFPWTWEFERTLLQDTHLADATLLEHGGLLWLFGTTASHDGKDWEDLHLLHATSLEGPWTPHPLNPVVSDVRSARPAGRIFLDGGALIRPAQDCSVRYGYAMTLNRIDVLTTSRYAESRVGRIGPEWYPRNTGTHTIEHSDEFEVIDGRAPAPRS